MNEQPALFAIPQDSLTTDDWYTPRWIFDALKLQFDLDVACPPEGPLNTPAKSFYTQETDGLASPWYGIVYMNPPYSKPAPWVEKWQNHANGIALLPFAKSKWCESLWNDDQASMVYIRAIKFDKTGEKILNQAPFSVGLWAIGEVAVNALKAARIGKVR